MTDALTGFSREIANASAGSDRDDCAEDRAHRPNPQEYLLARPCLNHAAALGLTPAGPLIILTRVTPGHFVIPGWVMRPRLPLTHRPVNHRAERLGHRRCPFVDVDDESAEPDQRRDVVEKVAFRYLSEKFFTAEDVALSHKHL